MSAQERTRIGNLLLLLVGGSDVLATNNFSSKDVAAHMQILTDNGNEEISSVTCHVTLNSQPTQKYKPKENKNIQGFCWNQRETCDAV